MKRGVQISNSTVSQQYNVEDYKYSQTDDYLDLIEVPLVVRETPFEAS